MMSCLPSTVLLVILIFKAEEVNDSPPDDDVIEGYAGGKYDSRLLLCWCGLEDPPPAYGPWVLKGRAEFSAMEELRQLWGSKEPTFWDRGLRIIEERKRS
ncbi:hypothetical protein DL96DRAFT_1643287 [Flagelloscypha sp. PMI_526]|nr:hypothetical protein DL96DRAFT_1643287 [Flagelloscypha sp. PMI_526]